MILFHNGELLDGAVGRNYSVYFDEKSFCGKCFNSIYSRSKRICEEQEYVIQNCVEYVENQFAECLRCEYGYGLNKEKQCHKCKRETCAICNEDPAQCTSFFNGKVASFNELTQTVDLDSCKELVDEFIKGTTFKDLKDEKGVSESTLGRLLKKFDSKVKDTVLADITSHFKKLNGGDAQVIIKK